MEAGSAGRKVVLRDVTEEDLPVFFEHQQDPQATEMAAFPARDRDAFMAHWRKILADETVVTRTILVDGDIAGNVVSFEMAAGREVGYWLGREFWGGGVATKALALFLQIETRRPLSAHVAAHNIASRRVLEKCGFVVCGEAVVTVWPEDRAVGERPDELGPVVEEIVLRLR